MALSQSTPSTSPSHARLATSSAPSPSLVSDEHPINLQNPSLPSSTQHSAQSVPAVPDPSSALRPPPSIDTVNRFSTGTNKHRQSTLFLSPSKHTRGALSTLAALARDKTTSAIASLSEPSLRSQLSSRSSLYRTAQSSLTASQPSHPLLRSADSQLSLRDHSDSSGSSPTPPSTLSHQRNQTVDSGTIRQYLLETDPPSQADANTASDNPTPTGFIPRRDSNKMHQTSSRLLRMTNDDRPFTRVGKIERRESMDPNQLTLWAGFQGFICNLGSQSAAGVPPHSIDPRRAFFSLRRSHQQSGLAEVLPIQSHARSQGSLADCHYDDHDHLLDGPGDGAVSVPKIFRRPLY